MIHSLFSLAILLVLSGLTPSSFGAESADDGLSCYVCAASLGKLLNPDDPPHVGLEKLRELKKRCAAFNELNCGISIDVGGPFDRPSKILSCLRDGSGEDITVLSLADYEKGLGSSPLPPNYVVHKVTLPGKPAKVIVIVVDSNADIGAAIARAIGKGLDSVLDLLTSLDTDDTACTPPEDPALEPDAEVSPESMASPEAEASYEPGASPEAEVSSEPEASPEAEVSSEPEAPPEAEVSSEPEAPPEAEVSSEPEAPPEAEVSFEPEAPPEAEASYEPEASYEAEISCEPEGSSDAVVSPFE